MVKWSAGELAVDDERTGYLGPGQLLEPVDTSAMTVTFKLHQCYPASRYIVTDHSIPMAAEMTSTGLSPRLQDGPTEANATGRTNVFMNGISGPGPMGCQPSAFDLDAGDPAWSPYWDHFTYAWVGGVEPRLLVTEQEVHAARDAGEPEEFPGTPDADGLVFTVNCPVPILAPPSFAPDRVGAHRNLISPPGGPRPNHLAPLRWWVLPQDAVFVASAAWAVAMTRRLRGAPGGTGTRRARVGP